VEDVLRGARPTVRGKPARLALWLESRASSARCTHVHSCLHHIGRFLSLSLNVLCGCRIIRLLATSMVFPWEGYVAAVLFPQIQVRWAFFETTDKPRKMSKTMRWDDGRHDTEFRWNELPSTSRRQVNGLNYSILVEHYRWFSVLEHIKTRYREDPSCNNVAPSHSNL